MSDEEKPERPARGKARQSGASAAAEESEGVADEMTEEIDTASHDDWFQAPGFQRMRTEWGSDSAQMSRVSGLINDRLFSTFPEAYQIIHEIYLIVRDQAADPTTGEVKVDASGLPIWVKDPLTDRYVEDWSRLSSRQRENFLYEIVTGIFEWEQRAGDMWTEAMMSKGLFTESFSIAYDEPSVGTVDDRKAVGNKKAAENRYFALMNAALSRKSEALVRSMNSLMLRLRDSLG